MARLSDDDLWRLMLCIYRGEGLPASSVEEVKKCFSGPSQQ